LVDGHPAEGVQALVLEQVRTVAAHYGITMGEAHVAFQALGARRDGVIVLPHVRVLDLDTP
jgi:hypothetical protein